MIIGFFMCDDFEFTWDVLLSGKARRQVPIRQGFIGKAKRLY